METWLLLIVCLQIITIALVVAAAINLSKRILTALRNLSAVKPPEHFNCRCASVPLGSEDGGADSCGCDNAFAEALQAAEQEHGRRSFVDPELTKETAKYFTNADGETGSEDK